MSLQTWNMARKLKITENGKYTPQGREIWREKLKKKGKFSNVHCRTWNMARNLKIIENEKHPFDDLKNHEITEKCTHQDLEYGEKTENHEK